MDEPLPSTPADDTVYEDTDDSTESNPKDGNVVLAQPVTNAVVSSLARERQGQYCRGEG